MAEDFKRAHKNGTQSHPGECETVMLITWSFEEGGSGSGKQGKTGKSELCQGNCLCKFTEARELGMFREP